VHFLHIEHMGLKIEHISEQKIQRDRLIFLHPFLHKLILNYPNCDAVFFIKNMILVPSMGPNHFREI